MTTISTWINTKLEYISGTLCGISVIAFDIPTILMKIALAVVLGGAGAFGSHLYKIIANKFKKK